MKTVFNYLGWLLIISAFFRIPPIIAAVYYGEPLSGFVISVFSSLFLGFILHRVGGFLSLVDKDTSSELSLSQGLMLSALSFIVIPIMGCISFLKIFNWNVIDALFESFSGFTTTGFTLLEDLSLVPKSLLLWRAETQWIGGFGVILVFLFLMLQMRKSSLRQEVEGVKTTASLYLAQGFPIDSGISMRTAAKDITKIYLGFTFVGILLLLIFGSGLFEASALTFVSLSTGGFSVDSNFYSSFPKLMIVCLLMILGTLSFFLHRKLLQGKFSEFFKSKETRLFFGIVGLFIILSLITTRDLKLVIYNVISSITTTGLDVSNVSMQAPFFVFLLLILMIIGGSVPSTAGGIKLFRLNLMLQGVRWMIKKISSPQSAIIPFKVDKKPVNEIVVLMTYVFVSAYILLLFFGTVVFMLLGYNFFHSSFQMISALGTVGSQSMSLASVPLIGKLLLMAAMLLGRLEIFPVLVLLRRFFRN